MVLCLARCVMPAVPKTVSSPLLLQASVFLAPAPRFNSNRTCVVRCDRNIYERLYPVVLVQPDGSTLYIKYNEPRRILMVCRAQYSVHDKKSDLKAENYTF